MSRLFPKHCQKLFAIVWVVLAVLSMMLAPSLLSQTAATGALTGTVRDSSGAVVPNATVTATAIATSQTRTTTTTTEGLYKFGLLAPGEYKLEFDASGFERAEVPSVTIIVTETTVFDQPLQVGVQTQQVEVHAETEAVQTATSTVGTVVSGQAITALPLTARNYTALLGLSAGANVGVGNAGAFGRGTQDIAVNGASTTQNNYQVDGVAIVNFSGTGVATDAGGASGIGVVNPDAIQEFKIQTSLFDAGYGRNVGGNVNVVTRSGTNQFHGSAFEFFRNTDLNANDFFRKISPPVNGVANNGRQVLNQNQFGGVFGGPVKKDKLFFFTSYQETRQKNGVSILGYTNPTLVGIPLGDRSNTAAFQQALGAAFCPTGSAIAGTTGKTSVGGVQVSCNGSNINPVAIKILQLKNPDGGYFVPSSTTGQNQNVTFSSPALYTEHQAVSNLDYVVSSKNTLSGRWFYSDAPQSVQVGCGVTGKIGVTALPCLPNNPGQIEYVNQDAVLRLTSILTNNVVNEARFSFQKALGSLSQTGFKNSQVGIASLSPGYIGTPGNDLLDFININGLMQFGGSLSLSATKHTAAWEMADQISWSRDKHTLRAGFEYERDRVNWVLPGLNIGNLTFQTFQDFLLGMAGCDPTFTAAACTASGALGLTNGTFSSNISSTGTATQAGGPAGEIHHFRSPTASAFVQDDFQVSRNLTLNLGLRWEYDSLLYDNQGQATDIWPSLINTVPVPGIDAAHGTLAGFVVPSNYNPAINPAPPVGGIFQNNQKVPTEHGTPLDNFAPRLGFAWKPLPTDRFVVRGGAGYFYDRVGWLTYSASEFQAVPYSLPIARSGAANYFSTFAQPYLPLSAQWTPRWVTINPVSQTGTSSNLTQQFVAPAYTTPTTYQFSLNVQYEFLPRWIVEVGYVGTRSIHGALSTGNQINEAMLVSPSNSYNGITTNTVANASVRVPYLGFAPNGLTDSATIADSKFNSLQATVRTQFSHGVQLQAAYTYSRALTTNDYFAYNDPTVAKYGLNPVYRPQRLTINYSWDLPFGNHEGFLAGVANGWNLSGVTVVQDGTPLTITDTRGGTAYGFGSGTAVSSTAEFAAGMGNANVATPGSILQRLGGNLGGPGYLNKTAFLYATGPPVIGSDGKATGYGNAGYGIILGPAQFNFDAAVQKTTRVGGIHEDASLVFRTEFFNMFNHPQFNNPGVVDVSKSTFGQITSTTVNPRLIQFALKYVF